MPTSVINLYILISSPFLTQQQPPADTNTACLFEVFQFMWPGSADRKYTRGRCQQSCVSYTVRLIDNVDNMASFRRSLFSRNSSYNVDVRMKVGEWDHRLRGQAGSMGVLERMGGGGGRNKCWVNEEDMLSIHGFQFVLVFCFLCLFKIVGDNIYENI